jgi:hypothetical protein
LRQGLRNVFEPEKQKVVGWRKMYSDEHHFYSWPNQIMKSKTSGVRGASKTMGFGGEF